jgi:hypothetical protein
MGRTEGGAASPSDTPPDTATHRPIGVTCPPSGGGMTPTIVAPPQAVLHLSAISGQTEQ